LDKASTIPLVLKNALSRVATSTEMIDRILKRVAGFSVVLAKENAAFDAFVKEEVAPRHSHLGRR